MRPIDSLDDLRKAKRAVRFERSLTRQALKEHLGFLQRETGRTLFKKVVIPSGLGLLTSLGIKQLLKPKDLQETQDKEMIVDNEPEERTAKWLNYLKIFLSILKIYQGLVNKHKPVEIREEQMNQA